MNEKIKFTDKQLQEIKEAKKDGGVFVRILSDASAQVEILKPDGNGGWKVMRFLSKRVSKKLYDFYEKDKVIDIAGFLTIALESLVE